MNNTDLRNILDRVECEIESASHHISLALDDDSFSGRLSEIVAEREEAMKEANDELILARRLISLAKFLVTDGKDKEK